MLLVYKAIVLATVDQSWKALEAQLLVLLVKAATVERVLISATETPPTRRVPVLRAPMEAAGTLFPPVLYQIPGWPARTVA